MNPRACQQETNFAFVVDHIFEKLFYQVDIGLRLNLRTLNKSCNATFRRYKNQVRHILKFDVSKGLGAVVSQIPKFSTVIPNVKIHFFAPEKGLTVARDHQLASVGINYDDDRIQDPVERERVKRTRSENNAPHNIFKIKMRKWWTNVELDVHPTVNDYYINGVYLDNTRRIVSLKTTCRVASLCSVRVEYPHGGYYKIFKANILYVNNDMFPSLREINNHGGLVDMANDFDHPSLTFLKCSFVNIRQRMPDFLKLEVFDYLSCNQKKVMVPRSIKKVMHMDYENIEKYVLPFTNFKIPELELDSVSSHDLEKVLNMSHCITIFSLTIERNQFIIKVPPHVRAFKVGVCDFHYDGAVSPIFDLALCSMTHLKLDPDLIVQMPAMCGEMDLDDGSIIDVMRMDYSRFKWPYTLTTLRIKSINANTIGVSDVLSTLENLTVGRIGQISHLPKCLKLKTLIVKQMEDSLDFARFSTIFQNVTHMDIPIASDSVLHRITSMNHLARLTLRISSHSMDGYYYVRLPTNLASLSVYGSDGDASDPYKLMVEKNQRLCYMEANDEVYIFLLNVIDM